MAGFCSLCTLQYHRLRCSNLSLQPHSIPPPTPPCLPPSPSQPRACSCSSLRSSAPSPAATGRSRSLRRRPPAPSSPSTASSALLRRRPCDACPHFCFVLRLHHNELCVTRPRRHARAPVPPTARTAATAGKRCCLHPDTRITVRTSPQPLHPPDYSTCFCAS
jgi:hypothetical protein